MSSKGCNIIVMGTSAGGLAALDELVGALPTDLPASIFIVQHIAPENTAQALLHRLGRHRAFDCKLASDGEMFEAGRIYIAPADYHLLVKEKTLLVTKGARENRYRPAIDPKDAAYPDMPESALNNLKVDYCVSLAGMGALLEKLAHEPPGKSKPIPRDIRTEAEIAERVLSDIVQVNSLGSQVPYNCPNCGGVLWEMENPDPQRFRCHTGHSFTSTALLAGQSEKIEESLWVSLRMLEERRNLLNNMAQKETRARGKRSYTDRKRNGRPHRANQEHAVGARIQGQHPP
jgi:two-component system chemotaxis response regulator CheB